MSGDVTIGMPSQVLDEAGDKLIAELAAVKKRIAELEAENKTLRAKNAVLEVENADLQPLSPEEARIKYLEDLIKYWRKRNEIQPPLDQIKEDIEACKSANLKFGLDPLSGVFKDKDYLDLVEHFYEENEELVILFIDFNNFKLINDNYGHDIGDLVIMAMGHALNQISGLAFRRGGDEFIMVVEKNRATKMLVDGQTRRPETDIVGLNERIIELFINLILETTLKFPIGDRNLEHIPGIDELEIMLSTSCGVATATSNDPKTVDDATVAADRSSRQIKGFQRKLNDLRHLRELTGLNALVELLICDLPKINIPDIDKTGLVDKIASLKKALPHFMDRYKMYLDYPYDPKDPHLAYLDIRLKLIAEHYPIELAELSTDLAINSFDDASRCLDGFLKGAPQLRSDQLVPIPRATGRNHGSHTL